MLKRIFFLLIYMATWVLFFELARVFFLFYQIQYTSQTPGILIFQTMWVGLKMDISMASYFTAPVCLFVLAGLFISWFNKKYIYKIYSGILVFLNLVLIISDAELYKAWGHRIDFTFLKYLSNPREIWASISYLPVFWILFGLVLIFLLVFWGFQIIINKASTFLQNRNSKYLQGLVLVIFTGLLIIPVRGGLQLSPLNQSSVFFSNNQFANQAAINTTWNFMYSVTVMNQLAENPYKYFAENKVRNIVGELYTAEGNTEQVITVSDSLKPNIILIAWESFTEKAMHETIDGKPVIQYFPELIKDGIYFANCYSSGDRTDKGISAILSGYPALPKGSIVNYPEKTSKLPGLGAYLLNQDYSTSFYYGGEPEFANIKSYLTAQQFQNLVTKENFNAEDMNSKWGAHDDVVMNKILNDIGKLKQPYFINWLTLSSHEPFETPVPSVFNGKDKQTRFMNSLHYSDSIVFSFISALKKRPEWNNTLVIISADHGHYLPVTGKRADDYRIPVLWLGGALKKKNIVIEKTISQLDIATTLFNQFEQSPTPFQFGKNIFDSSTKKWAFFTYNDGIGYITDSSRLVFDNVGKKPVFKEGKTNEKQEEIAKALMQLIYSDFLRK